MSLDTKITPLLGSEEETDVRGELQRMVLDVSYNTTSKYIPSSATYPDGLIPFVDRHMKYLGANPKLDARLYLANLRLMTRISR